MNLFHVKSLKINFKANLPRRGSGATHKPEHPSGPNHGQTHWESCYQQAASNFLPPEWKTDPSLYYRFPVFHGKSNILLKQVMSTSNVHLLCCESSCVARTAAPVNCSFCTPARVTLRRKLRQADKVTAAQVTRHRQYVPSFQLQTPSSHQALSSHVTLWTSAHPHVHVLAH